jgi:quercetin dioxygenase-like cupin family protein
MKDRYVRQVDWTSLEAVAGRVEQDLVDAAAGLRDCNIRCIKTPPAGGSPAGRHTHPVDQIFYILKGIMTIEIEGERFEAGPGALVVFPAGVPHRNWNGGTEPTVHIAITQSDTVEAIPAGG